MIGLDTNVLARYLLDDDPLQSRIAAHTLEGVLTQDEPGFVSTVTLAELVWVLTSTYRRTNKEVVRVLEGLLQTDSLILQNEPEVFAATLTLKSGVGSFADALIGHLNTASGCTATLTFDKRAARLPGFQLL